MRFAGSVTRIALGEIARIACIFIGLLPLMARSESVFRNDRYALSAADDGTVTVNVAGMPPQKITPEFTVLWSEIDPLCTRNASHPNYPVAPRNAVRWSNPTEPLDALNAWVGSPEFKAETGMAGSVKTTGQKREWEFRDAQGKVKVRVTGDRAFDTTRPFTIGNRIVMKPARTLTEAGCVRWVFAEQTGFALSAEMTLPPGEADPVVTYVLTPKRDAFFSVAFTGAPDAPVADTVALPQECDARSEERRVGKEC